MGPVCIRTAELSRSQSSAASQQESCRYARILAANNTVVNSILAPFTPAPMKILVADYSPVKQSDAIHMVVMSPQAEWQPVCFCYSIAWHAELNLDFAPSQEHRIL